MNVLVTGANGLLATNTIFLLLKQGYSVIALVRNKRKFISFEHPNLELLEGDITQPNSLDKAFKKADYVVHAAANTSQNLLRLKDYYPVNVEGTKNIISYCKKYNVKKMIFIGTANSFGYGTISNLGNEKKQQKAPFSKSFYAISKLKAQQLINEASKNINVVSICPTFMIGPYDAKPSSGKIILMAQKKIVFYPPGGKNFISVKDVASAIIKALKDAKNGDKYILSNENLSYKAFFKLVFEESNKKPILIKLPKSLLIAMGLLGDFIRFLGFSTSLSSVNIKLLLIDSFYSNKKAKEELNINFTNINTSVKDALNWFKSQGVI